MRSLVVRRRTESLLVLVALDLAGFGMIVSDIQFRLEAFGLRGWAIGAVLASMFVVQFPASALWGRAADRIGARRVMVACTLISAASMALYGLARSPETILVSRLLAGAGAANVAMAYAIASFGASEEARSRIVGRLGAATVLGLTAGAALGGLTAERFGQTSLGFSAASLSLLAAAVGAVAAPTTLRKPEEGAKAGGSGLLRGRLLTLLVVAAVGWLSLATLEGTFGRLIHATLGFGQREFGLVFGLESLVAFVAQAFAFERLLHRVSARRLLALAFALTGLGLAAMPFAPSLAFLLAAAVVYALGSGLATPSVNDLIARYASEERRGEAYGALQSLRSVGFVVGPLVGGVLFDLRPALPYLVAGAICVAVALVAPRVLRPESPGATPSADRADGAA